ncbi:MAG: hypothetical protein AAF594_17735, partial [Bacteroidota bacterium]
MPREGYRLGDALPSDARPEAERGYASDPEAMPEIIATPLGVLVPHIRFIGSAQVSGRLRARHAD